MDAEGKVIDAENNDYVALKALEPTHPDNPFEKLLIIDYDTREWGDLSSDNPPDCPVYPEELLSPTLDLLGIIDFSFAAGGTPTHSEERIDDYGALCSCYNLSARQYVGSRAKSGAELFESLSASIGVLGG